MNPSLTPWIAAYPFSPLFFCTVRDAEKEKHLGAKGPDTWEATSHFLSVSALKGRHKRETELHMQGKNSGSWFQIPQTAYAAGAPV